MKNIVMLLLFFASQFCQASERDFWGTKILVDAPNRSVSEACDKHLEFFQFMQASLLDPEVLVTCFVNPQEMSNQEKTIIYRLSTLKTHLPNTYSVTTFRDPNVIYIKELLGFNVDKDDEFLTEENSAGRQGAVDIKTFDRENWKLVFEDEEFALLQAASEFSAEVDGKEMKRRQVIVSGIILIGGKIAYLRITNSKDNAAKVTVKLAKNWAKKLISDNR